MRYGHNMHNTRKLPLVVSVNAIRMVRIVYMEIELELCIDVYACICICMFELSSQTNVLDAARSYSTRTKSNCKISNNE